MSWWEAVVLGLVQGLTEFLPISSSAHIRIIGELIHPGSEPGTAFTAITQIGTETAVLLYFRRDIKRIVVAWCKALFGKIPRSDADARMGWLIIVGSVPILLLGLAFQDSIDTTFRNLYIVAAMLIGFGVLLGWADHVGRKTRHLEDIGVRDGILYGFAQALALIPGVSRSGGTITAGLLMGYTREAAARYSFLLAIPAVLGSGLFKLIGSFTGSDDCAAATEPGFGPTLIATIVAFVVGYLVIIAFLKIISNYSYMPFVYYRIALGVLVVILCLIGVLEPGAAEALCT